jgi:hypothetical protein
MSRNKHNVTSLVMDVKMRLFIVIIFIIRQEIRIICTIVFIAVSIYTPFFDLIADFPESCWARWSFVAKIPVRG